MNLNHQANRRRAAGRAMSRAIWPILFALVLLFTPRESVAQTISREYQLKAVFIFNFAQFVEWPTNAFTDTNSPIVIGILGTDPFGRFLDETVRDETVGGRRLEVRRFTRVEDVKDCHILYLHESQPRQLIPLLQHTQGKPILTVSDLDAAAVRGVIIRMYTESNRIRLTINLDAARAAGLTISSKLLRTANIISSSSEP